VLAVEALFAFSLGFSHVWLNSSFSFDPATPVPEPPWYEDALILGLAVVAFPGLFLAVIGVVDRGPTSRVVRIVLCVGLAISILFNAFIWLYLLGGLGPALATSLVFGSVIFVCGHALVRQGMPLLRPAV
jgi:hypothetical protein